MGKLAILVGIGILGLVACGGSSSAVVTPAAPLGLAAYNQQIQAIMSKMNTELKEVADSLDIGAFDNRQWQEMISQSGDMLESLTLEAESLRPPDELAEFHESWLTGIKHYGQVGTLAKTLSTSFDSEVRATGLLEEISKEMVLGEANIVFAQSVFDKSNQ